MLIPLEPKVGLTSDQAVNSSLSVVSRSKKTRASSDSEAATIYNLTRQSLYMQIGQGFK